MAINTVVASQTEINEEKARSAEAEASAVCVDARAAGTYDVRCSR